MTLNDIINTAAAEIGYCEGPNNDSKYGAEYGLNYQPWCVMFLWWVFKHAGSDLFPQTAHCDGVRAHALQIGRWITGDYKRGDCIIFDYDGNGSGDHIALVDHVNADGSLETIEGNYADRVMRVCRWPSEVSGAYRPAYDAAEENPAEEPEENAAEVSGLAIGSTGAVVSILQYALHVRGFEPAHSRMNDGDYDGEFGAGTQAALDRFTGIHNSTCTAEVWKELLK